jgi:hypothetical protein
VSLQQAAQEVPMLARLAELTRDSAARLLAIEGLIPRGLRPSLQAGPIDGDAWCLIVNNNATASKIRQLLPTIQAQLKSKGWEVNSIRVKVQITHHP